jgi:hypothetical protein
MALPSMQDWGMQGSGLPGEFRFAAETGGNEPLVTVKAPEEVASRDGVGIGFMIGIPALTDCGEPAAHRDLGAVAQSEVVS